MRALFFLLLTVLGAGLALAQSPTSKVQLEKLEAEQAAREQRLSRLTQDATAARREIVRLRQQLVDAAKAATRLEETAAGSAAKLRVLRQQERTMTGRLVSQRKALEDILAALISFERQRPPALAVNPNDAREAARAATLMGYVTPSLEARARAISAEIATLKATRAAVLAQDQDFQRASAKLAEQRALIDRLIANRLVLERSLLDDAASERARIAEIAARAASLRDLIDRLQGDTQSGLSLPPSPDFPQRFAQARGRLAWPADGKIVQRFGASVEDSGKSEGILLQTPPNAQVTAPFDGKIEFAGQFRSYGRLLIINVGGGYHVVLAGLGNLSSSVGQEVLAGEPVGDMAMASGSASSLYIEIRRDGQPQNPAPWFNQGTARQ